MIPEKASPGRAAKRLTFAYGRTLVAGRVLTFSSLTILIAIVVAVFTSAPLLPVLGLTALLAAYFVLFAVSPLLTQHWITRSRLILRQGWYFRAVIPFADIEEVGPADESGPLRTPLGISRPFGQPVLFVTGGRTNLVRVRLREPRRFWQSFGLSATQIVFDAVDRDGLVAILEERARLLPPVQADRPSPDLRD